MRYELKLFALACFVLSVGLLIGFISMEIKYQEAKTTFTGSVQELFWENQNLTAELAYCNYHRGIEENIYLVAPITKGVLIGIDK